MDLAHPCLWVSDLDRALEFYAAIGLERQWSFELDGVQNVYVGDPDGDGEIQFRYDPDRTTPIAPNRADVDHLGFVVDDVDATYEAALEAGASEVIAPKTVEAAGAYVAFVEVIAPKTVEAAGAYVAFVEDPEGYTIEFYRSTE